MSVNWQLVRGPGFTQFADLDRSDGWFASAKEQSSPASVLAMNGANWDAQVAAVLAALLALGNGYRSINTPPQIDPEYRRQWISLYGASYTDPQVAPQRKITWSRGPGRGAFYDRIVASLAFVGTRIDPDHLVCGAVWRATLDSDGKVSPDFAQYTDLDLIRAGASDAFNTSNSSRSMDPYTWDVLTWRNTDHGGIPAGPICAVSMVVPPLVWAMEFIQAVSARCVERGAALVLEQSRQNAIAINLVQASALGIVPSQMQSAAQQYVTTLEQARQQTDQARHTALAATASTVAIAAAAAIATGPPQGPIAAALIGLVGAIAAAFENFAPIAIGVSTGHDPFGRIAADPRMSSAWESAQIAAGPDDVTPPRMDVPDPPSFVRRELPPGVTATNYLAVPIAPEIRPTWRRPSVGRQRADYLSAPVPQSAIPQQRRPIHEPATVPEIQLMQRQLNALGYRGTPVTPTGTIDQSTDTAYGEVPLSDWNAVSPLPPGILANATSRYVDSIDYAAGVLKPARAACPNGMCQSTNIGTHHPPNPSPPVTPILQQPAVVVAGTTGAIAAIGAGLQAADLIDVFSWFTPKRRGRG